MIDRDDRDRVLEADLRAPPASQGSDGGVGSQRLCRNAATLADDAPHLLVVDDDRRIRDLLSRFLAGEGYRVTTADNARDARAKLTRLKHFDMLVLDVMMPGRDRL